MRRIRGHYQSGGVTDVALTGDGRWLVTCGYFEGERPLAVWDLRGPADQPVATSTAKARQFALSPDGQLVAGLVGRGYLDDPTVEVFRLPDLEPVRRWEVGTIDHIHFSPDGRDLVGVSDRVDRWDAITGEPRTGFPIDVGIEEEDTYVDPSAFRPDGAVLAVPMRYLSGPKSGLGVRLWSYPDGKALGRIPARSRPISAVTFSPDGRRIAGIGAPNVTARRRPARRACVVVWDAATGREVATLKPAAVHPGADHDLFIRAVRFTPDGGRLAVAAQETVRLYDAANWQEVACYGWELQSVNALAFSADGALGAACGSLGVAVWDME